MAAVFSVFFFQLVKQHSFMSRMLIYYYKLSVKFGKYICLKCFADITYIHSLFIVINNFNSELFGYFRFVFAYRRLNRLSRYSCSYRQIYCVVIIAFIVIRFSAVVKNLLRFIRNISIPMFLRERIITDIGTRCDRRSLINYKSFLYGL